MATCNSAHHSSLIIIRIFKEIIIMNLAINNSTIASAMNRPKQPALKSKRVRCPLPKDTILKNYYIFDIIGSGSFSLVYRAKEISTNKIVTIKEYFPKKYARRSKESNAIVPYEGKSLYLFRIGLKQFFNEAIILKNISHPNVLKLQNIFRANKSMYLVTDYAGKQNLMDLLKIAHRNNNTKFNYEVILPVLSVLNHIHSAGVMHLDIKPSNIMISTNGVPRVIDFGAAQPILGENQQNPHLKTFTHGYAPSEQYDKTKKLDPSADIYAVAATIYNCITGGRPAKANTLNHAAIIDIKTYGAKWGKNLINAVNCALSADPFKRYATADKFAYHLLEDTKWLNLADYETKAMSYNRKLPSALESISSLSKTIAI